MSSLDSKYAFRREMVDRLVTDLYGPQAEDELLTERPLERYVTGVLWPSADSSFVEAPDEPESVAAVTGESTADSPVANARLTYPSSVGMTVSVDTRLTKTLVVSPSGARYSPEPTMRESGSKQRDVFDWQRHAVATNAVEVDLSVAGAKYPPLGVDGLQLYALVRSAEQDIVTVTVVLRNMQPKPGGYADKDVACWFQVGLSVSTTVPALVDRSKLRSEVSTDPDLATAELLYRNHMVFGAGHGCAVSVNDSDVDGRLCQRVSTSFVPRQDVYRSMAGDSDADLSLSYLGAASRNDVVNQLKRLINDYSAWIETTGSSMTSGGPDHVPDHLRGVAVDHLANANEARDRIKAGVELLADDDDAFEAFQLANQAMNMQRSRQDWIRNGAKGEFKLGDEQEWRPFQIAFILINLPSVTQDSHPERDFADLLWFPTGGGKTEAYLGLIAYLLFLRRLRDTDVRGVAVVMRYTLRLLTIQQFERAAMLICSLESVRRNDEVRLGGEPFGIGLWVGAGATPNDIRTARTNLGKLRNNQEVVEGNPRQIETCPWCGSRLSIDDYRILKSPTDRMIISCPRDTCEFSDGLPVHIVDSDVYRERPELVIGTVDKFAGMSWRGEIATLFGRNSSSDLGPDLIIQDELHLISGPLGSTVGLFETAVDLAAGGKNRAKGSTSRRPKVIASTATIRRAEQQIRAVFNRESRLFPPPGIDPDDSFFSKQAPADEYGSRQYVGVLASGTSHATLMVRTYASVLHSASVIEAEDDDRDPYWTLVGYFNSLRVLGSAYLQVYDDVRARLNLLARREGRADSRNIQLSELTSRVENHRIPEALKSLEKSLMSGLTPEDVVLATNMISVGLDVDRLGLMTVMGQPQSSAEYIQATSRVGRRHPGLVVTIFNAARTRDRSHYESFNDFHGALYRAVEATSATPFAARSRDRGLHATLVSALRMLVPELRSDAGRIRDESSLVDEIISYIAERVKDIDGDEATATRDELERLLNIWRKAAVADEDLSYEAKRNSPYALLIDSAKALEDPESVYSTSSIPWPTPRSMRDVDAETTLRPAPMRKDASS